MVRVNPSNKLEKFLLVMFQYHGPHIRNSFFTMNYMFLFHIVVVDHVKFNLPTSRCSFMDSNSFYSNPSIVETITKVFFLILVLHDCHIFSLLFFFSQDLNHSVKLISITWFSSLSPHWIWQWQMGWKFLNDKNLSFLHS